MKKALGVVLALLLGVIGAAYLIPAHAHVERSTEIAASPDVIFPYLNDLKKFGEWAPWLRRDPTATQIFTDQTAGVGASYSWTGDPKVSGSGRMTVVESEADRRVRTHLEFDGQGDAYAELTVVASEAGSRVTWAFDVDAGMNPMSRYFNLMMEKFLGPDYEEGLASLKTLVESLPAPAPEPEVAPPAPEPVAAPAEGSDGSGAAAGDGSGAPEGSAAAE